MGSLEKSQPARSPGAGASVALIVMGVAGSGKSTVGRALATALHCRFFDGDDYHPPGNVALMAQGTPLTDVERGPWLDRLAALIADRLTQGETTVIACSALKRAYRNRLRVDPERVRFIYLHGSEPLLWERIAARSGHFMRPEMLRSQLETLEPPVDEAIWVSIDQPVPAQVAAIVRSRLILADGVIARSKKRHHE